MWTSPRCQVEELQLADDPESERQLLITFLTGSRLLLTVIDDRNLFCEPLLIVNKQDFILWPSGGRELRGETKNCTLIWLHLTAVLMNLQENGYHGSPVDMLRFDQPAQLNPGPVEGLRPEDCRPDPAGSVNGDAGGGMRMRSLSLDPPPQSPTTDMSETVWPQGAEEEAARAGAWRRESYHQQQQQQQTGPSSWHGDNHNMRPPQPWEPSGGGFREQAWRRDTAAVGGRYEQGGFLMGESGWQQQPPPPAKEAEASEVDPGWRLPNIPRRGQDAGWRQTEFIVSIS
jgi:hypothetical protein